MHLIETTPAPCIHCGAGNTPGPNGERRQFVDLEREVNFDEPVIICEDCVLMIAGILGMPSQELIDTEKRRVRKLTTELHKVNAEKDSMTRRARKIGMKFEEAVS